MIVSVILRVDFHLVTIVHLLLDVLVHLCCDFRLVVDLVGLSMDSFCGPVVIIVSTQ